MLSCRQARSFATACHLPREERLAALQTRSTLERLELSLVGLSRRRRRLRLEVALLQGAKVESGGGGPPAGRRRRPRLFDDDEETKS